MKERENGGEKEKCVCVAHLFEFQQTGPAVPYISIKIPHKQNNANIEIESENVNEPEKNQIK